MAMTEIESLEPIDIRKVWRREDRDFTPWLSASEPLTRLLVVRRGFDLVEGGSSAADFCDDLFGGLVPDEGLGVVVPVFGPDLDGIDEVGHAGEHASA